MSGKRATSPPCKGGTCAAPAPAPLQDPLLAGGVQLPDAAPARLALPAAALMGAAFGFAIQKGRVYEPAIIEAQLAMRRFAMLKMFLSAAAASLAVTAALAASGRAGRSRVAGARKWAFNGYRGGAAAVLGGLVLGVGMALSGACPGTGPVQLGAGVRSALWTVLGGFAGAAAFGAIEPSVLAPSGLLKALSFRLPTFDSLLGAPFSVVAGAMSLAMVAAVYALERAFPWRADLGLPLGAEPSVALSSYAWPPYVAGAVVGSLQLPGLLLVRDTIGSSRAYVTAVVQLGRRVAPSLFSNPYFCGCACGVGNYQQLLYLACSVLGAYVAAALSGSVGAVSGFGAGASFVGGFLTVFGGRLAGGCTSGQGISGNAVLGLISPLATASMFAGGIATVALLS